MDLSIQRAIQTNVLPQIVYSCKQLNRFWTVWNISIICLQKSPIIYVWRSHSKLPKIKASDHIFICVSIVNHVQKKNMMANAY
jgi:hypothetical protein